MKMTIVVEEGAAAGAGSERRSPPMRL